MRTRMPPKSRVRQIALPRSPGCSVAGTLLQSVVPNGMSRISISGPPRTARENVHAAERRDILALLIEDPELAHHRSAIGLGARRLLLEDAHLRPQRIAGAHRPGPADLVHPRRAQAAG